jgi:hypothetical protein
LHYEKNYTPFTSFLSPQLFTTIAGTSGWRFSISGLRQVAATSNGSYVYRIKEVDKDGSSYLSNQIMVRIQGNNKMSVNLMYPNPVRDVLHYYVSASDNNRVTLTITSMQGKILGMQRCSANQTLQLGVKNLPAGVYLLNFTNEATGEKIVNKLVKL